MSLDAQTQRQVIRVANDHWSQHVRDQAFTELISGKEPGHRMADYVDDRTTSLLKVNFDTRYESSDGVSPKKRSMGDVWVHSNGMFNPINVKAGLQGMSGQPNLVSMQKLLDYVFRSWIDSYYLLIIKFDIGQRSTHKAFLIDLLEWTDFMTYDAGPGQIMLREREFYDAFESGHKPPTMTIARKVDLLFTRFEEGVTKLFENRRRRLVRQRKLFDGFDKKAFTVDQSDMKFVP